jgi:hypothetical protein
VVLEKRLNKNLIVILKTRNLLQLIKNTFVFFSAEKICAFFVSKNL